MSWCLVTCGFGKIFYKYSRERDHEIRLIFHAQKTMGILLKIKDIAAGNVCQLPETESGQKGYNR